MPLPSGQKNQNTNNMPLQNNKFNSSTQILVWKITETYELFVEVVLKMRRLRLGGMKSELPTWFLSVRMLCRKLVIMILICLMTNLANRISRRQTHFYHHSYQFSAIIISDQTVGIDKLQREKIIKILQ
jgi:hypothetical protein